MRKRHAELCKRAERNVDSYSTSTYDLDAADARFRVVYAWLQGYEAARRDMLKARKK